MNATPSTDAADAVKLPPPDTMGVAMLAAWDRYNGGAGDAVHPMFAEAFTQGFLADRADRAAAAVPAGYALVSLEPTEDMFIAGMEADCLGRPSIDDDAHVRSIWNAMLAATPGDHHGE